MFRRTFVKAAILVPFGMTPAIANNQKIDPTFYEYFGLKRHFYSIHRIRISLEEMGRGKVLTGPWLWWAESDGWDSRLFNDEVMLVDGIYKLHRSGHEDLIEFLKRHEKGKEARKVARDAAIMSRNEWRSKGI